MNKLILYQQFLNERRKKRALRNGTLDEELFQNDLTEELTIENSNIVINLTATLIVLEKCQFICVNFSKEIAKLFSGSARTSANNSSSFSVLRLAFFVVLPF